ncbi:hypothetical protein [Streptomyces sp. S1]|uniref:hypothetical protein n=1 Tax=Streptomyces sp. S1 TaxID=718288 RepID=UPI003D7171A9
MTAREYKEWEAYERAVGPLDSSFERELLCELHELIQLNNLLTGASVTKKGKRNPAGKFKQVLRPHEIFFPPDDYEEEEEEDDEDADLFDFEIEEKKKRRGSVMGPGEYDPSRDPFAMP